MPSFDPLADLDGVRTYQERVMVRAVRLTRDNASAIAKLAQGDRHRQRGHGLPDRPWHNRVGYGG